MNGLIHRLIILSLFLWFTFYDGLVSAATPVDPPTSVDGSSITAVTANSIFDFSLEDLARLKIDPAATLTPTDSRLIPAAVTVIDSQQIERSGARSLDELLDIYVPSLQMMFKNTGNQLGIRGVISDRNNKYLLLVNGEIMNGRTSSGAHSERFLSMLGDIKRIEVIRGPGAATYGPGAIAGVISIHTFTGMDIEGADLQLRQGLIEQFTSLEIRYGHQFSQQAGLFVYYGVDDAEGTDQADSPLYFSHSHANFQANRAVDFEIANYRSSYEDQLRHKFHVQYSNGGFTSWLRYTRGGIHAPALPKEFQEQSPQDLLEVGYFYQQYTLLNSYEHNPSNTLALEYRLKFDLLDTEINGSGAGSTLKNYVEEEYRARVLANWTPNPRHALALGVEYSHEKFGEDGLRSGEPAHINNRLRGAPPWSTDTYSLLGEYQWQLDPNVALFLGARGDKHTYTDWLVSPRVALVYSPTERDAIKLIANKSMRRSDDSDLREKYLATKENGIAEEVEVWEVRYERQHSQRLRVALSAYHNENDIVSFSGKTSDIQAIGLLELVGVELEAQYQAEKLHLTLSHDYTKLLDFDLADPATSKQNVSAQPYGYGSELANWSKNTTKLSMTYDFNSQLAMSASLRYYWGYPGAEDMAHYNSEVLGNDIGMPIQDETGSSRAFEESVFLNMGLTLKPSAQLSLRLDLYNVLGWADKDYNKRNQFWRSGQYRDEAAALGLSLRYTF